MSQVKKVILSPNPYRDRGLTAVQKAEKILREVGVETRVCLPFYAEGSFEIPEGMTLCELEPELRDADMLICFGGDGTILHAAREAALKKIPVMGVNMGSVGFMAELESGELHLLKKLADGNYRLEERMMLDVEVYRNKNSIYQNIALNDAVITMGTVARTIRFSVFSDEKQITKVMGDGVVISTPNGSTAYSMAAGGPIVEPTAENLIVTPICAYALQAKSFVLGPERKVTVRLERMPRKTASLSVDGGRPQKLLDGDQVVVRKSPHVTRMVRLTNKSFYEIINRKLSK